MLTSRCKRFLFAGIPIRVASIGGTLGRKNFKMKDQLSAWAKENLDNHYRLVFDVSRLNVQVRFFCLGVSSVVLSTDS